MVRSGLVHMRSALESRFEVVIVLGVVLAAIWFLPLSVPAVMVGIVLGYVSRRKGLST